MKHLLKITLLITFFIVLCLNNVNGESIKVQVNMTLMSSGIYAGTLGPRHMPKNVNCPLTVYIDSTVKTIK